MKNTIARDVLAIPLGVALSETEQIAVIEGSSSNISSSIIDISNINANNSYISGTSGYQIRAFAASNAEHSTSSGVQQIRVQYLDANYEEQTEDITLSGVSIVSSTATNILFVNKVEAISVGASGVAGADIYVAGGNPPGENLARIDSGTTSSKIGAYTAASGVSLLITDIVAGANQNNTTGFDIQAWIQETGNVEHIYTIASVSGVSNEIISFNIPILVKERDRIRFRAISRLISGTAVGYVTARGYEMAKRGYA